MKFGNKSKGSRQRFEYKPRTVSDIDRRINQQGGAREGFIRSDIKVWTPKEENVIRILPPAKSWQDKGHYGYEVFVHYGIGADNSAFLCLEQMKGENCPICDERIRADQAGEEEIAKELRPAKRVAMYIIDRKSEKSGPQIWVAPWTVDRDISALCKDPKTGGILNIDDPNPDGGYDVSFNRGKNSGGFFEYTGIQIDRRPSPLSDDDDQAQAWLEYIERNPIPEVLVFADKRHIAKVFSGEFKADSAEKSTTAKSSKEGNTMGLIKKGKKVATKKQKELTWDDIHSMSEEELEALIEEKELDASDEEFDSLEQAQDWVCEQLSIEKPEEEDEEEEKDEEDEEEEKPAKKGLKVKGKGGSKKALTWEDVHSMSEEELEALMEEKELDASDEEFDDIEQAQDWVCEQLNIEKPEDEEEEEEDEEEEKPAKKGLKVKGKEKPDDKKSAWKAKLAKLKAKAK
jgi:hypothetical protein